MLECSGINVLIDRREFLNSPPVKTGPFLQFFAIALIIVIACSLYIQEVAADDLNELKDNSLDTKRKSELLHLLKQDCGSCHGLLLNGGLGPPLKSANLRDKTVDALTAIILHGNAEAAMPPWKEMLKESEARWIALQLKQGVRL